MSLWVGMAILVPLVALVVTMAIARRAVQGDELGQQDPDPLDDVTWDWPR